MKWRHTKKKWKDEMKRSIVLTAISYDNSEDHTFDGRALNGHLHGNITCIGVILDMLGLEIKHKDKIRITISKEKK
jgi:hypothetical protein